MFALPTLSPFQAQTLVNKPVKPGRYMIKNLVISFSECVPEWYGDKLCDDVNNKEECEFDGGDCCRMCVDDTYCSECTCVEYGYRPPVCHWLEPARCNPAFFKMWWAVGDGICDDSNNVEVCSFDGGDCCLSCIKDTWCQDCHCGETNQRHVSCQQMD